MGYEQLYYDLLYENKKLQQEVENLKSEISINNKSDLIKFIINETKGKGKQKMKLFEAKDNIITINIDTNIIRKFNIKKNNKINLNEYNEYLIEKAKNGNLDYIMKSISIIKNILLETGCSNYEQLYKKQGE